MSDEEKRDQEERQGKYAARLVGGVGAIIAAIVFTVVIMKMCNPPVP